MKNSLNALLPALALLALGGCATTGAIATSEDDGVYYSSNDRNTAIVAPAPATPAAASSNEATNPDYNGAPATAGSRPAQSEYYDDYASSRNNRTYVYAGPGVAYYAPVVYAPYTTLSYGWGAGYCGFSPYGPAFCDPFYSPFYSPLYGFGPGVSINIGYGRPWGYGGFYSPYYGSPWASSYGGFYDPYYYGGRYYGGYYGPRGYYGNNYAGGGYYGNSYYGDRNQRRTTSGHRSDRASSGGRVSTASSGSPASSGTGGGRVRTGERATMADGLGSQVTPIGSEGGRGRTEGTATPMPASYTNTSESSEKPQRYRDENSRQYGAAEQSAAQPVRMLSEDGQPVRAGGRGRMRNPELTQPAAMPEGERKPRRDYYQEAEPAPANTGYATPDGYARPQQAERPARQRTYEQPQRAEQPTYSAPTYSTPSYGGSRGSSGGGGGGRSRGRAD